MEFTISPQGKYPECRGELSIAELYRWKRKVAAMSIPSGEKAQRLHLLQKRIDEKEGFKEP